MYVREIALPIHGTSKKQIHASLQLGLPLYKSQPRIKPMPRLQHCTMGIRLSCSLKYVEPAGSVANNDLLVFEFELA